MTDQEKEATEDLLISVEVKPQLRGKGQGQTITVGAESYVKDQDDPDDVSDY
jgi:hypothetical protein